jgi:hypothetical protein
MELAAYLAGERWSDDPACTHPLLAALARDVNDYTSDTGRARLAGLVPSVIGLAGEDLHIDGRIALLCARTALPVVDGRPAGWLDAPSRAVLAQVPLAARWARGFTGGKTASAETFRRHSAPATVHAAVKGIAQACIPEPDRMLYDLLTGAIDECAAWADRTPGPDTGRGTAPPAPDRQPQNAAVAH